MCIRDRNISSQICIIKFSYCCIISFNLVVFFLWSRFADTVPIVDALTFSCRLPFLNLKMWLYNFINNIKILGVFIVLIIHYSFLRTWHHILQTVSSMHLAWLAPRDSAVHTHSFASASQSPKNNWNFQNIGIESFFSTKLHEQVTNIFVECTYLHY